MKSTLSKLGVCAITLATLAPAFTQIVQAEEGDKTLNSNGVVKFIEDTDIPDPTDPDNPDPEFPVDPIDPTDPDKPGIGGGTAGPLSLNYVPSFDFGQHKLSLTEKTYMAKSLKYKTSSMGQTVNYAQVTDKRKPSKTGWTLSLTQDGQFKSGDKELTGAQFKILSMEARTNEDNKGTTAPTVGTFGENTDFGTPTPIMAAAEGAGKGLWVDRFGTLTKTLTDQEDSTNPKDIISDKYNKDVELTVPGNTAEEVEYTTTFTWTLSETPSTIEAGK